MPVRRQPYQRGALYLPREDQWGSHRRAPGLIFYWLVSLRLIFYWLAPPSSLSLLAGSSWGQPVSCAGLRWRWKGGGEGVGGTARMTGADTDSSITSVGKIHNPVSTFRRRRQSHYCLSFSLPLPPPFFLPLSFPLNTQPVQLMLQPHIYSTWWVYPGAPDLRLLLSAVLIHLIHSFFQLLLKTLLILVSHFVGILICS